MPYISNLLERGNASSLTKRCATALVALVTLGYAGQAMAQGDPAAPEAPAAPDAPEAPAAEPAPEAPEAAPAEPAPETETAPMDAPEAAPEPMAEEAMAEPAPMEEEAPAEEAEAPNPVNVGVWGRIDFTLQDPEDPEGLGDIGSTGVAEFHFSGKLMPMVGYTANLVAGYGGGAITGDAGIMDAILELGFHDAFNVWAGRMLVATDRSNFSGPWFMMAWDYPGLYVPGAPPIGPHEGPSGRNDGLTVWGNIMDGHLKYYAGVYDLFDASTTPLISTRINLALINPEPGFYSNSTYLGGKDVLAIGAGFQTKKGFDTVADDGMGGTVTLETDDYSMFNADVLFEKNFGEGTGTLNAEAAFYSFSGDNEPVKTHLFGVLSYLIPGQIGPGQLMPLVRFQTATTRGAEDNWTIIEGYLNYIPKGFNFNTCIGFVNKSLENFVADGEDYKSNELKLGLQWIH